MSTSDRSVQSMTYRIEATVPVTGASVSYQPMDFSLGPFQCHLEDETLTVTPDEMLGSVIAAIQEFRPFLQAWQSWSLLNNGVALDATYQSAELFGGETEGPLPAVSAKIVMGRQHPSDPRLLAPPEGLGMAPGATFDAVLRWREVLEGGVSTSVGAYGIVTVLEHIYGGRRGVSQALKVSSVLLSQLGKLTSTGDTRSGRKVGKSASEQRPLTNGEERWIEGLIVHLIYRSLAVEVGGTINEPLTTKEYSLDTTVFRLTVG